MVPTEALDSWTALGQLALQIIEAGMLAFGGLGVVLQPLYHAVVDPGLMSGHDVARSYALSSFAPGPNGPIFLALLGWSSFGLIGVLIAVAAWALPSLLITHQLGRISEAGNHIALGRLLSVLKAAAVGLVFDGVLALLGSFERSNLVALTLQISIALVGSVLLIRYKLNPLVLLAGAMVLGAVVH